MYKPTESEKCTCICIVKDILGVDDIIMCEEYIDDILGTAYAIGGDYSEQILRSVAEVILKEVKLDKKEAK